MTHEEQREELSKRIEELTDELENLQDEFDDLEEELEAAKDTDLSDYTDEELLEELKNRRMDTVTVVVENLQQKELLLDFVHKFIWTSVNDQSTKVF